MLLFLMYRKYNTNLTTLFDSYLNFNQNNINLIMFKKKSTNAIPFCLPLNLLKKSEKEH